MIETLSDVSSAGLAPGSREPARVKWVDAFEDGQGRGQMTAACAAFYNYEIATPQLFGVVCLGLPLASAQSLSSWDANWASIMSEQGRCQDLQLTWAQLESIRAESDFTEQCAVGCSEDAVFGPVKYGGSKVIARSVALVVVASVLANALS